MKSKIAKQWISALLSGKYAQTTDKLRSRDKDKMGRPQMCCLAVLCDVHAKATGKKWGTDKSGGKTYLGKASLLPLEVARWAGIRIPKPKHLLKRAEGYGIDPFIGRTRAAARNDTYGQSFKQIAAAIKRSAKNI